MKKITQKTLQIAQKHVNILGVNVLSTSKVELLTAIEQKISHNEKLSILTPNPELVLASTKNKTLKEALNTADFAVPDGVGLNFASKFLYGKPLEIIPGRKLFLDLIELAAKNSWKVFLLGGLENEAELCAEKLKIENSLKNGNWKLEIAYHPGPNLDENGDPVTQVDVKSYKDIVDKINKYAPYILFVAFGNPKQEIWINKCLKSLRVRCAVGVGGTFRYVAGLTPLPPKWMENLGLEWLFRLTTEPIRFGRIVNAVVVFPWKVFLSKIALREKRQSIKL